MNPAPRSLADTLRQLSETDLAQLLRRRPDLTHPAPVNLDEVVERSSSQASTHRALENLDAWTLQCARAMAALEVGGESAGADRIAAGLGMPEKTQAVQDAIQQLRGLALCWGEPPHLTQAARAAFGTWPAGLAGPSPEPMAAAAIVKALDAVGSAGREILQKLVWGPPTGTVQHADRPVTVDSADSTIDLLLAYRLLRPLGPDQVILPREVSLHLRGGLLVRDPMPASVPSWGTPGTRLGADLAVVLVDRAAIGSAQEFVSHVVAVLDDLAERTPRHLRTGGIPKKEMAALTRLVGDPDAAEFAVAMARGGRMLVEHGPVLAATPLFDSFLDLDSYHRWLHLRSVWETLGWWPQAADERRSAALRAAARAELTTADPGTSLDAAGLGARLAWRHPSWSRVDWQQMAGQLFREAQLLGMVAFGRSTVLASLPDGHPDPGFAPFGSTLILQSDLSAVAPAPLDHATDRAASLLAVRESHGATATFRFTAASVRAALDAGWSREALIGWLREHNAEGPDAALPEPLRALIDDTSRRHGQLRVMAVTAVVQVDDEATAAGLLAAREAPQLGLAALAPGVLGSSAEPEELVSFLRRRGLAPIAQDHEGAVLTTPPARRAPAPAGQPAEPAAVDTAQLAARLLRRQARGMTPEAILAALAAAHEQDRWVGLEWADSDGATRTALVRVLSVDSGLAHIVRRGAGRLSIPVARIIGVDPAEHT
ncbi:Helicase conserved C-terminal domain-containing protein [Propionibacterium cyclohexanicum]|uniref:Helicase conserved C-terminal domain-containing protein n=1 Tax=Propionibacterium cyclohexanicum TaxID=64702 RepID=A0A1H9TWH4_9ACTN|nr:helicase-associated domain-containing protein [Propionibacterium cyclohexanicum]SES01585.1 Helicase conserved C-terminal domain-containing protein [Propionibacterium cyclohexanicum]